jgi:hypothetical protein
LYKRTRGLMYRLALKYIRVDLHKCASEAHIPMLYLAVTSSLRMLQMMSRSTRT